jgi:non-specific serine/threonine protein kinase
LDERFRLLTSGGRTVLPRQQTLRALIDWSFDLLTEPERALLRRLAVFAGGWTLEAAEVVGADSETAAASVLDLLTSLIDKSLVVVEAGRERYRLLETVRAYARERLHDSSEGDATRTRHLEFFLALAERASKELWGANQGNWVARLDLERENLLAAHAWCDRASAGAEQGLRLTNKLQLYWLPSGLTDLGYRLTLEALARPGALERNEVRCGALYAASQLAYFMGRFRDTRKHGEESLSIAREIGDRLRAVDALLMLGYAADELKQPALALTRYEESIALARELGNRARLSYALNALAGYYVRDAPATAAPLFEESLALAREVGDHDSVAVTLQNLARTFLHLGRSDQACKMILESLNIAQQIGSRRILLDVLHACAALAAARAQWAHAARFLGASDEELARLGLQRLPGDAEFLAPMMSRAREEMGATEFATEEAAARALSHEEAISEARRWLARAA